MYESYQNKTESPKPGDYVICQDSIENIRLNNFINNNIGQIIKHSKPGGYVICKYNNIPKDILRFFKHSSPNSILMSINEIKYWSPNKKELETILLSKKFNI